MGTRALAWVSDAAHELLAVVATSALLLVGAAVVVTMSIGVASG